MFFISCTMKNGSNIDRDKAKKNITELFEQYYEELLKLDPLTATSEGDMRYNDLLPIDISLAYRQEMKLLYSKYKNKLETFDRKLLSHQDQLSYDILIWECKINLEQLVYPTHLMPINHMSSLPLTMGTWANGRSAQPFKTIKDYDDWLKRIDAFTIWCDTAIVNMKKGMKLGYVLPSVVTENIIPQMETMAGGNVEDHIFYQPIHLFPEDFNDAEKQRLRDAYAEMINVKIIPTYSKMQTFLQTEYLPSCRMNRGVQDLPNGEAFYNHSIKRSTTTNLSSDEIFNLGKSEVAKIQLTIKELLIDAGFKNDYDGFRNASTNFEGGSQFTEPQEVIDYYYDILERIKPYLENLFDKTPITQFEVRRVESFREKTASASYSPGLNDGSRPGIFYIPIPDAKRSGSSESLFLHEAIPGHHFQMSLQRENEHFPNFRRQYWNSAFVEGWALYTESLGKELGLYSDSYQYIKMLMSEYYRAIRLVVDTGIHSKGWTHKQSVQYFVDQYLALGYSNVRVIEGFASREVERYMVLPGQALSYKIGQLKFLELRAKAEKALGANFDIKSFHNIILENGCVPIAILDRVLNQWIDGQIE